jgi:hypothetical protein
MSTSHPTDEDLSAHLDGEAPEVADHVAACAACHARLDDLRRAAALVAGAPPPRPPAQARDDAIARALDNETAARPRRLALLAAAAAVLVAAGIATPLLLRGDRQRRTSNALSSARAASGQTGASTESGADSAASLPIDGGDIGAQSDPVALGSLVSSALAPETANQAAIGAAGGGTAAGSAATPAPPTTMACPAPANGGQVVYRAALRWKGAPAQLFAIQPGRRLVVMDSARCRVLVDRHF